MQFRATSALLTSNVFTNLAGITTGILLARLLGPTGRGELANFVFMPVFLSSILGLSLSDVSTFHVARLTGKVRERAVRTICGMTLVIAAAMGIIAYVILIVFDKPRFVSLLGPFAILYVAAEITKSSMLGLSAGRRDYYNFAIFRLIAPMLYLVFLVSFALFGHINVNNAIISVIAASALSAVLQVTFSCHGIAAEPPIVRAILSSSWRLHPSGVLRAIRNNFDRFVIILILPPEQVGQYFVAVTFASAPLAAVQQSLGSQFLTDFSSAKSETERMRRLKRAFIITIAVSAIVFAIITLVLPFAVPLLVGAKFKGVPTLASILALAFMLRMITMVATAYMQSHRATGRLTLIEISYIVSFLIASLVTQPDTATEIAYCVLLGFIANLALATAMVTRMVRRRADFITTPNE